MSCHNCTKYGIGAVVRGQNNWQPRNASAWQKERASPKLLPMPQPKRSLFDWIWR